LRVLKTSKVTRVVSAVSLLAAVVTWAPCGFAAPESKWTIDNKLSAYDVDAPVSRDAFGLNDEFFVERLVASELVARGRLEEAIDSFEYCIRAMRKSIRPDDSRLQSLRIALADACMKNGQSDKSLEALKLVLKQRINSDFIEESKFRARLSTHDLLEKDVETPTQFALRYENLNKSLRTAPVGVIALQARRLFWDNRLSDCLRMTNIGLSLADTAEETSATAGDVADLVFLKALVYFTVNDRAQLVNSIVTLKKRTGSNPNKIESESNPDADKWNARLTLLDGLIAQLDKNNSDAQKLFRTALDAVKVSTEDRIDEFLIRTYLGNCLAASGDPIAGYEESNHAFEDSRRLIEGRKKGLEYMGIARSNLNSMYQCLLIRMSDAVGSNLKSPKLNHNLISSGCQMELSEALVLGSPVVGLPALSSRAPSSTALSSTAPLCSPGLGPVVLESCAPESSVLAPSVLEPPVRQSAASSPTTRPNEENYQHLADALYHVGYQNKTTGNLSRARQLFWWSAEIYEKYLPANRSQLSGVLYDLAESFAWSDARDLAVALFERCAELRKRIDPQSTEYIATLDTLGRAYMANREPKKATAAIKTALHLFSKKQEMQADRVNRLVAQIKSSDQDSTSSPLKDSSSAPFEIAEIDAIPLDAQLAAAAKTRAKADKDARAQIDDLWQVLADSYSRDKNYDEAKKVSRALLELRKSSGNASKNDLLGSIWQYAYICGVSNSQDEAKIHYGEMIDKYNKGHGKALADWYYNRGVAEDSLGQPAEATRDFKKAVSEYKFHLKSLDKIDDAESIQQIGWLIGDLQFELKAKAMCPPESPDYFHSYPHFFWSPDRYPLKIYIDDSETRGFGPELYSDMRKAVTEWSDTPGMKDRFVFVDDREKADIYFERMSNYDLIPFGSGGGATASFVNRKNKLTKEIDRVHLRLYCRERDVERLSNHAIEQLYTLALHEFGHGLGLGHSPSGGDVMYWKSAMNRLSSRDRSTLRRISGFKEGKPD